MSEMTEHERATLGRYVRALADVMELRDWTIEISRKPCDSKALATCAPVYGRKLATLEFSEGFRDLDAVEQRNTVVHELVHCHLEPASNMVYRDLEEFLGKQTDQIFYNGFKRQLEYSVDALAAAIAKHLPLIDWTGGQGS